MLVKIYGERRCGTYYITRLIGENFDVKVDPGTNKLKSDTYVLPPGPMVPKHVSPVVKRGVDAYVCIVRNPYLWLLAYHDHPYANRHLIGVSFSDFLKSEVKYYDSTDRCYSTPIEMWNKKTREYIEFSDRLKNAVLVTHEEASDNPIKVLNHISDELGIAFPENPIPINNQVSSSGGIQKKMYKKRDSSMSESDYKFIASNLDREIMNRLGYEL